MCRSRSRVAEICFEARFCRFAQVTSFWGVGHVRIAFSSVPSIGPSLTPPPPPFFIFPLHNSWMEATWTIRWCVQCPLSVLSSNHFEQATRLPSVFVRLTVLNKADDAWLLRFWFERGRLLVKQLWGRRLGTKGIWEPFFWLAEIYWNVEWLTAQNHLRRCYCCCFVFCLFCFVCFVCLSDRWIEWWIDLVPYDPNT